MSLSLSPSPLQLAASAFVSGLPFARERMCRFSLVLSFSLLFLTHLCARSLFQRVSPPSFFLPVSKPRQKALLQRDTAEANPRPALPAFTAHRVKATLKVLTLQRAR